MYYTSWRFNALFQKLETNLEKRLRGINHENTHINNSNPRSCS